MRMHKEDEAALLLFSKKKFFWVFSLNKAIHKVSWCGWPNKSCHAFSVIIPLSIRLCFFASLKPGLSFCIGK